MAATATTKKTAPVEVQPIPNAQSAVPAQEAAPAKPARTTQNSVVLRLAARFGMDWKEFYNTVKNTCFRGQGGRDPSNEELSVLLMVADRLNLNPTIGEIYAFPNKTGGIVPIVGVNGWRQIATSHPEFAGLRFEYATERETVGDVSGPAWVRCIVKRRSLRDGFVAEIEGMAFFDEKYRPTEPWKRQPRQMLSNKALIQALKNAFPSLSSVYDEEEGREAAGAGASAAAAALPQQQAAPALQWTSRAALKEYLDKVITHGIQRKDMSVPTKWALKRTSGEDQQWALAYIAKAVNQINGGAAEVSEQEPEPAEDVVVTEPQVAPQVAAQADPDAFDEQAEMF